ncbi:hypothetical protein [Bdellovibrio bacteriovorus]|uniref:hypothetical protein n=1 Tax=Bdellovibrio bacteriovorus TaxID=959 RepID=UPI003AA89303
MLKRLIPLFMMLALQPCWGAPLGTIPTIEEDNLRLIFDFRSDLWSSPYTYKDSPVRIVGGDIRIPIYKSETWSASARIFDENLQLGRAQFNLGGESIFIGTALQNQGAGFGVRKVFASGSMMSVFASYATASDVPWGAPRNDYFDGTISYRMVTGNDYHWIFAVNQSDNRGIYNGMPYPFIGVVQDIWPGFRFSLGLPFLMLEWGATEEWVTNFSLTPFGVKLATSKNLDHGFVFQAKTALTVRSYMFDTRKDSADRLYYQEIFAEGALKKFVTPQTGVSFALGAAVDRRLYESERIYVPNSKVTTIKNDFYGRLGVEFRL